MSTNHHFSIIKDNQLFDLSHGFLPAQDPILQLNHDFLDWEDIALSLPKLITNTDLRELINGLEPFPVSSIATPQELERAMLILSYLGHAYVWCDPKNPAQKLPAQLALAWYDVATKLNRPPVLSYASYALYNWCRLDTNKPIELGNIVLLQNFLGGADEEWFILIHIDIEYKAIPLLASLLPLTDALKNDNLDLAQQYFSTIITALEKICATMERMPEHCDPYIYFNRVRPYIHGWKDSAALTEGLIYTGVAEYSDKPVKFKGETGTQSSILPCIDALLGIEHEKNILQQHLEEMQQYMPAEHRQFLQYLQKHCNIRDFVQNHPDLIAKYNECVQLVFHFRSIHLNYAKQ